MDSVKNTDSVDDSLVPLEAPVDPLVVGIAAVGSGRRFLPQQQVLMYSPDEWEDFIEEWLVSCHNEDYSEIRRFAGAGDMGLDVVGLTDDVGLKGVWDAYQCKHLDRPIGPGKAAAEIAKILWHSFDGAYEAPRKYYFVAPFGCSTALAKMLSDPPALKAHIVTKWETQCATKVFDKKRVELEGTFKIFLEDFDFARFTSVSLLTLIREHQATRFHASRFGGGLPQRPAVQIPPQQVSPDESRYVQQLYEAYEEHVGTPITQLPDLGERTYLVEHFHRQRESFYHAEALRNFARDAVPDGTFEDLQAELYSGVVDVEAMPYEDAFLRLGSVLSAATSLHLTSNGLINVVRAQDRKGMCHQLANVDMLRWSKR